ncbi:MAG: BatD family protein [Bacteroidetes bacterium]|nr:BatD family protein [Bacteroidota bacterium]
MKKTIYILFYLLFLTNFLLGQKLTTTVSTNKVAVGEPFQIQFSLNGTGSNFKLPPLSDFEISEGPFQSSSTSITNGSVTQSSSLTYVLIAKKEGKLTIGSATAISSGKTILSNPVIMEVSKGKASNGNPSNNSVTQNPTKPSSQEAGNNIFVRTVVNKSKVYLGEVIDVTFKVYTKVEMQMRNFSKVPSYAGFFVQDIKDKKETSQKHETIDGVTYIVGEIYKTYLIPQHTGKLVIDPFEIECIVRQRSNRKPRNIQEQFFGVPDEEIMYPLKSLPITIDVQALPEEGKPESFSGAVGNYTYKAVLSKDKIKANEAVNFTLSLSGSGNIKLIEPIKVNFPEDFETYDAKTNENINVNENGISGTKTFDYLIIPRHEGDYTIDPINFSYFDPIKKAYITLPSPDFKLHVEKGEGNAATVVGGGSNTKEELKVLGNDIRYIKTNSILKEKDDYFFGSILFYSLLFCPLFAFLFLIAIRRKSIEQNKDIVAVKSRKATKMARKKLSLAEQHLRSNNKELFYIEIFKALYGYISDKLNIPVSDLNKEHISEKLTERNVSETTIKQLISTLDNCEFAHYAPGSVSGDLKNIFSNTVELITKIEDEIV